jgi:two-component system, OmpR family, sensor histidine kinase VicK
MSASAAELHFAAEFVTFLAAAVGLAVVLLRGDLLTQARARAPMAGGFAMLGAAAFLHGSLVVDPADDRPLLFILRTLGVIGIGVGAANWVGPAKAGRLITLGAAILAGATAVGLTDATLGTSVVLAIGSLSIGFGVVFAARRSIASRVAASASLTLLLVVLVLAVGISAVLSSTVEDQARERLATRAGSEAKFAADPAETRLAEARLAAGSLQSARRAELLRLRQDPNAADPAASVTKALADLSHGFFNDRAMLYVEAGQKAAVAQTPGFPVAGTTFVGLPAVSEAITQAHPVASLAEVSGRLIAFGAHPVNALVDGVDTVVGAVVVVSGVDSGYLETRVAGEEGLGLAVAKRGGFLGPPFGRQPPLDAVGPLIEQAFIDPADRPTGEAGGRFFAVAALVDSQENPVAAMVISQPTSVVADTREELYRILFLIALGGTLLALALAALVGNNIGAGLRRLTVAAEGIQAGDFATRVGIEDDDEVGVLGAAFNSMAGSIQEKTTELQEARVRLEAVVAGMGEALVATDADGRITDFNRSAEELLGIGAAEAKGRPADEVVLLRGDDGSTFADRLLKPSPRRWTATGTVESYDGTEVPVAVSAGALRGLKDELAGEVFVLRDLRKEREVERMKTEFLSRIGHELRTPLTGITGYAELLTRKSPPPELAKQWYNEILKQSRNLLRIVQMLEFFASTGANRTILRPEMVDLRDVIDEVVDKRSAKLNGKGSVTRRVKRGVPKVVADERWLTLAVDELVDNAVKFSPEGCKVTITAAKTDDGRVEIQVADKGKGMTREEQTLAFAEFVQGDTSDTRAFGGLGLGLSLVQRVAEAHGGGVAVSSTPGKGSKFSIFLPIAPIDTGR